MIIIIKQAVKLIYVGTTVPLCCANQLFCGFTYRSLIWITEEYFDDYLELSPILSRLSRKVALLQLEKIWYRVLVIKFAIVNYQISIKRSSKNNFRYILALIHVNTNQIIHFISQIKFN